MLRLRRFGSRHDGRVHKGKVAGEMKECDGATKRRQWGGGSGPALLAVVLLLAAWAGCAHAENEAKAFPPVTWTVTDASDNPASPGENTLRGIIGKATDGDIISFGAGVTEISLQGELIVDKLLVIKGSSAQKVTIRQTAAGARVLSVAAGKSAGLLYLTITGGRRAEYGDGGGILNNGTLTIDHCTIVDNTTDGFSGGGVANQNGGTLTIKNSLVKGNSASGAGGVWNGGTLTMEDCVVEENTCSYSGGGVGSNRDMTLKNCTIRNNRSTMYSHSGGGVYTIGTATMSNCTVQGNSAATDGGGIYNRGDLLLISSTVANNTAANGGGIYSGYNTNLMLYCRVQGNTPDQIRGSYKADKTCVIGSTPGAAAVAFGGVAHGVTPEARKTAGEADVTKVENDLKSAESGIFKAVKGALSSDLGSLPGGVSATLYDAFAYENVPLADASGEGELVVEFTASWPRNVRYYAAFAEYEDAAASAQAVKGYVLAERGVQFEIKPGQALPDGVTPPDFYKEGEGLMTWRNVVADNGPYDHNRQVGMVTFRVASIRAEAQTAPTGGSGCSVGGFSPFALLLGAPLALLRRMRRR